MGVQVTTELVVECISAPTISDTKDVTTAMSTLVLTDKTVNATKVCSTPPAETAAPEVQHPTFSYANYNATEGSPVTLHYCTDLASFTAAVEHLKGENYLGIDIEHQPTGKPKKGQKPLPQSEEAKKLEIDATTVALKTYEEYTTANPDEKLMLIHKKNTIPSGFRQVDDKKAYARFTRYAKTKLSVFQIASPSHVIVAHFAAFPHTDEILDATEFIPPALKTILADATVFKMGVGVAGEGSDTRNCSRYFEMPSNGLLELNHLDALLSGRDKDANPKQSLKSLAEKWLGHTIIGKGYGNTTTSEWQVSSRLSDEQIEYAANDAFVSVKIYEAMMEKFNALDSKSAFPELGSEGTFEYTAWLSKRISDLEARGTKSSKKTLCALGIKQEPPSPLNVPEGGSRSLAQSQKRREAMTPEDAAMAEALTQTRDEIMKARNIEKKHWILDDRFIDRIAVARPRPRQRDDFKELISPSAWGKMERYAGAFLEAMSKQLGQPSRSSTMELIERDAANKCVAVKTRRKGWSVVKTVRESRGHDVSSYPAYRWWLRQSVVYRAKCELEKAFR